MWNSSQGFRQCKINIPWDIRCYRARNSTGYVCGPLSTLYNQGNIYQINLIFNKMPFFYKTLKTPHHSYWFLLTHTFIFVENWFWYKLPLFFSLFPRIVIFPISQSSITQKRSLSNDPILYYGNLRSPQHLSVLHQYWNWYRTQNRKKGVICQTIRFFTNTIFW